MAEDIVFLDVDDEITSAASRIISTWSGAITVTSGGRANERPFQNRSARRTAGISGRREPPPQR